jgi:hypothetical protein
LARQTRSARIKLGPLCDKWYEGLLEGELKHAVDEMLDLLLERSDAGDHIQRSRWPRDSHYQGINNLWRYELDRQMRAAYTLKSEGEMLTVLVIEIFPDHKSYEHRFGY